MWQIKAPEQELWKPEQLVLFFMCGNEDPLNCLSSSYAEEGLRIYAMDPNSLGERTKYMAHH